MHRLLERQIKRHLDSKEPSSDALKAFLSAVDEAYAQFDTDRAMSEHSADQASNELVERNQELTKAKAELALRVQERTAELRRVNDQLLIDIGERKAAEERLRVSEERYALAVRGANDGIWDWDLRAGVIYYSPRWKSMLGFDDAEIATSSQEWFKRIHAEDLKAVEAAISAHVEGGLTSHFEIEYRMMHKDGAHRWMLCRGTAQTDPAGKPCRIAGSQSDITERKAVEEQLLRAAFNDTLTGLPNRALFSDRLQRAILRGKRADDFKFAVIFMDMDRFKVINDSLGHLAGDQLLIAFAARLGGCLRAGDTLSRLGGDEFTILVEDVKSVEDVTHVADRIHEALKQPFNIAGQEVFTTASIGIAVSNGAYERPAEIMRDADTAMYRAKALGKARHQIFDEGMHARAVKVLQLENDLRRAIDRGELVVFYQPIMPMNAPAASGQAHSTGSGQAHSTGSGQAHSTSSGQGVSGMEALVRWRHPERGLIPPGEFIPVAEETGLILELGNFVLREACRQMHQWHQAIDPRNRPYISVNLSARQFGQRDLVEQVARVLSETQLEAKYLVLEITESVIMEHPDAAAAMLASLKSMGIGIDIDDFGTGYSSLGYLQRFPADTMKIDRSFVAGMFKNTENAEIIRTIISLAHSLNMSVTAEGIETIQQLEALRSLGCEHAQGYYFSKPIEATAAGKLIMSQLGEPVLQVA